jgi:hypothetical protein
MSIVDFEVAFGYRREDHTRPGVLTPVARAFAAYSSGFPVPPSRTGNRLS